MRIEKGRVIFEEGDSERHLELTEEQRNDLVVNNIKLVKYVVKKHFSNLWHFEYEDFCGFGMVGLVKAGKLYDPNMGTQFTSIAYKKIWGEIMEAIRGKSGMIGDRDSKSHRTAPIPRPFSYYEDKYAATSKGNGENSKRTAEEIFFEDNQLEVSGEYDRVVDEVTIQSVLNLMDERDRKVFDMYYRKDMNQTEISKVIGVSQVHVGRILKNIRETFEYFKPVLV